MKHNNLLDALDILRIRRIVSDLDTLIKPGRDYDLFTDHLKDVYRDRSDQGIDRSIYVIDEVGIPITPNAMHNALYCDNLKILKLLLERGGDVNAESLMSPLLVIINQPGIDKHDIKVIKILLKNGANILQHDEYVGNSLHLAAERGHVKVINILLDYAVENNKLEELLLPSPEKCWVCKGLNAYQIAQKFKHYEVIEILEQYFHASDDWYEVDNLLVEESCQSFLLGLEENNSSAFVVDVLGNAVT